MKALKLLEGLQALKKAGKLSEDSKVLIVTPADTIYFADWIDIDEDGDIRIISC